MRFAGADIIPLAPRVRLMKSGDYEVKGRTT